MDAIKCDCKDGCVVCVIRSKSMRACQNRFHNITTHALEASNHVLKIGASPILNLTNNSMGNLSCAENKNLPRIVRVLDGSTIANVPNMKKVRGNFN